MVDQVDINNLESFEHLLAETDDLLRTTRGIESQNTTSANKVSQSVIQQDAIKKTSNEPTRQLSKEAMLFDQEIQQDMFVQKIRKHYIDPLIELINSLFDQLFTAETKLESCCFNHHLETNADIIAYIRFSGPQTGIIAIAYPVRTALAAVSALYEEEKVIVNAEVYDAISEIVNIIAGKAQPLFSTLTGKRVEMTLPQVLRGGTFAHQNKQIHGWLTFRFESKLGPFKVYTSVR